MESDEEEFPELLTAAEVARIFRVSRSTVVGWASRGLLDHTRTPSGRLRFYRASMLRLLREGRGTPGPERR
ncbi:helix-turn-helix domain-containing protein [Actinomadura sp. DSM 109109]|nr:helix-turn-helix domain-containing protein [Actinomadura lepetitiana]